MLLSVKNAGINGGDSHYLIQDEPFIFYITEQRARYYSLTMSYSRGRRRNQTMEAVSSSLLARSMGKIDSRVSAHMAAMPPQLRADVRTGHTFRFTNINTSPYTWTVNRANMLDLLVMNTSTSTTNYRLIDAIRINRVSIYPIAGAVDSAMTTTTLAWQSTYGPDTNISVTSTPLWPKCLRTRPPKLSLASFWSQSGSNESDNLFTISIPVGAIIDVQVTLVIQNNILSQDAPVVRTSTSTGSAGSVYAVYLDGFSGGAARKLQPVAYQALT